MRRGSKRGQRARSTQRIFEPSNGSVAAAVWVACGLLYFQPVHAAPAAAALELPYAAAGLDERAAAAHLLDRLAFGARPGDIDRLLEVGLSEWIEAQIAGRAVESQLENRLAPYDALRLSAEEIAETFPPPGAALRLAMRDSRAQQSSPGSGGEGLIKFDRGTGDDADDDDSDGGERDLRREAVAALREQGRRSPRELVGQLQAQKVLRAVYAENQLHEVLVDFWFNHFNVSTTDNQARGYVLAYERDAIRPRVTASFRDLLEATARHPAMLQYLDNAQSRAEDGRRVAFDAERERPRSRTERAGRAGGRAGMRPGMARPPGQGARSGGRPEAARGDDRVLAALQSNRPRGLNENYARELLELHTLGVDGGYTQQDVVEVARAFTGWTVLPPRGLRPGGTDPDQERLQRYGSRAGFVTGSDGFFFHPGWHDSEQKTVLGTTLSAGRGIADGEQVLDLVATHPATARHIARKLAVRFVSDSPPPGLVDRLATAFTSSRGDIAALLRALVQSEEFWASRGEKVKSPFELSVSALRALGAEVEQPAALVQTITRMGQPLYAYQAPTGYPDRADFWVNTGALLHRMNFGLQLAAGRVRGVELDLEGLVGGQEPESVDDALQRYAELLLPERDLADVVERLGALARAPELAARVEEQAAGAPSGGEDAAMEDADAAIEVAEREPSGSTRALSVQAQVVGVLLGSPEFQQR